MISFFGPGSSGLTYVFKKMSNWLKLGKAHNIHLFRISG